MADEVAAANRLMRLAKDIAKHNRLYHDRDAPEIADADYDALVRENAALEAEYPQLVRADSPSRAVGAAPTSALAKVAHARPMLSLENAFAAAEVVLVLRELRGLRLSAGDVDDQLGFVGEELAQLGAQRGLLGDDLGDDVARARPDGVDVGQLLGCVDVGRGQRVA